MKIIEKTDIIAFHMHCSILRLNNVPFKMTCEWIHGLRMKCLTLKLEISVSSGVNTMAVERKQSTSELIAAERNGFTSTSGYSSIKDLIIEMMW